MNATVYRFRRQGQCSPRVVMAQPRPAPSWSVLQYPACDKKPHNATHQFSGCKYSVFTFVKRDSSSLCLTIALARDPGASQAVTHGTRTDLPHFPRYLARQNGSHRPQNGAQPTLLQFVSSIMVSFSFPSYVVLIYSLVCSHTIGYIL